MSFLDKDRTKLDLMEDLHPRSKRGRVKFVAFGKDEDDY